MQLLAETTVWAVQELARLPAEPGRGEVLSECLTVCLHVAHRSAAAEGLQLLKGRLRCLDSSWGFCRAQGRLASESYAPELCLRG